MSEYKIHLTIKSDTHPRKWLIEAVNEALNDDEDILEWEIESMEYSKSDHD